MLKFFKGKDKGNLIYAPCKGRVVPLAEVPDPVFADKVLGDGLHIFKYIFHYQRFASIKVLACGNSSCSSLSGIH